ncbi:MAG: MFS transporter [Pirellulales bacterium]|nr:MFS transporter [Pirellulales bacterium]
MSSPYTYTPVPPEPSPSTRPIRGTRKEVWAWAMYDWASSAWSTLQITIVVYYITVIVLPGAPGTYVYGYGIGISMFLAAIASPIIGALADARANKRTWLIFATVLGACCSAGMALVPTSLGWLVAVLFFGACLGFELCWGIYNGFLPEIADDDSMNRVSALGFGMGYIGGGLALLIAIVVLQAGHLFGLPNSKDDATVHLRIGLLITGAWWGLFSIPTFLVLRDKQKPQTAPLPVFDAAKAAIRQVGRTIMHFRNYGTLAMFLIGFLFYNDGMQTVITQASVFAERELRMTAGELAQMILMVQFVSLPGALAVGKLSDWIGAKTMLHIMLAIWVGLLVTAFFVTTKTQFWCMAVVLALVMGGGQSVSRAIMGFITPEKHAAEFMGFFNLSGRAASMLGPMLFSTTLNTTGSAHIAILSLLVFFIIGWALVLPVNIAYGKAQAGKA